MADRLFDEGRLEDVLEERFERADVVVDELPAKALSRRASAVKKALTELVVEVPAISRDKAKIEVAEGDPMSARLRIPYTGDPAMFGLRPSEYSLGPPSGAVSDDDGVLEFARDFELGTPPEEISAWAAKSADSVEQYLYWQAADLGLHRLRLQERVEELVDRRRDRIDSARAVQSGLDDVNDV
jgi:hypothetical protein